MGYSFPTYAQKMVRTYTVKISVGVDDAEKEEYKTEMEKLCQLLFDALKNKATLTDAGTGRLTVDVQRQKDA